MYAAYKVLIFIHSFIFEYDTSLSRPILFIFRPLFVILSVMKSQNIVSK